MVANLKIVTQAKEVPGAMYLSGTKWNLYFYVEPMEAGGKIEGGGINTFAQTKWQNNIFIHLYAQENDA